MSKDKEMDQLTEWALEAERLDMTYGAYVAKYHPKAPPAVRFPKKENNTGKKICVRCGREILPSSRGKKYCGAVCRAEAHEEQKMKRYD